MQIRTLAVGFLVSALLILKLSFRYVLWGAVYSPTMSGELALRTLSENTAHVAGVGLYLPAAFIVGCLGVGFMVAGIFYPALERMFLFGVRQNVQLAYGVAVAVASRIKGLRRQIKQI